MFTLRVFKQSRLSCLTGDHSNQVTSLLLSCPRSDCVIPDTLIVFVTCFVVTYWLQRPVYTCRQSSFHIMCTNIFVTASSYKKVHQLNNHLPLTISIIVAAVTTTTSITIIKVKERSSCYTYNNVAIITGDIRTHDHLHVSGTLSSHSDKVYHSDFSSHQSRFLLLSHKHEK